MCLLKYFPNAENNLTYAENLVLKYLENNISQVHNLTISKVALDNNVSTTTVVRLCKKLKVASFTRLKYTLEKIYENQQIPTLNNFYSDITNNFENTLKENSPNTIKQISYLIKKKKHIYIFSIGLTKTSGEYLELALQQLGLNCSLISDSQIIWTFDKPIDNSLSILISNSGESKELVDLCTRIIEGSNSEIVSITNSSNTTLGKLANYSLNGFAKHILINKSDFSPHFSLILIIDLIINSYLDNIKD